MSTTTFSSAQIKSNAISGGVTIGTLRDLPILMPILILYGFLAFYRIDHQSFWSDEVLSIHGAALGESILSGTIWSTGQGPLYFALLHLWAKAGQTEFVVRSLSAVSGFAAVCLLYTLSAKLLNRQVAACGALLLATSPFFIWYSQEGRYVVLAIVMALLSMILFCHALSKANLLWWLIYAISSVATLFSFVPMVFLSMAQGLYLVSSKERRPMLRRWIFWQVGIFAIFGVWFVIAYGGVTVMNVSQDHIPDVGFQPLGLATGTPKELSPAVIPYSFFAFSTGFSMGPSLDELHISRSVEMLLTHVPVLLSLTLLFGAVFAVGIMCFWGNAHARDFLLWWLVMPMLGMLFLAGATKAGYNVRYVCAALPAYIIVLAIGITSFTRPMVRGIVLAIILGANGVALGNYYFNSRYARADTRTVAKYLESAARPGDGIIVVGSTTALQYYYKGDLPIVHWERSLDWDRSAVVKHLEAMSKDYKRVWIVAVRPWEADPQGNVKGALAQEHSSVRRKDFAGAQVYCYGCQNHHL